MYDLAPNPLTVKLEKLEMEEKHAATPAAEPGR
jgi:hypothetical protein